MSTTMTPIEWVSVHPPAPPLTQEQRDWIAAKIRAHIEARLEMYLLRGYYPLIFVPKPAAETKRGSGNWGYATLGIGAKK